jgi:hypothetical protein
MLIGILLYNYIVDLKWIDNLNNTSMILTGIEPVDEMTTHFAKKFTSTYDLFSGFVFLSTVAIFFFPIAHRIMHLLRM